MAHLLELIAQIYADLLAPGTESVGRNTLRIVGVRNWQDIDSFLASLVGAAVITVAIVSAIMFAISLFGTS